MEQKIELKPYPKRLIVLPNGDEMIVAQQTKDEIEEVADEELEPLHIFMSC